MAEIERPAGLCNTTNKQWKDTVLDTDPQKSWAAVICGLLFCNAGGYVKVGQYGKHGFYRAECFRDPSMIAAIIGSRKFDRNNAVISVGTYKNENDGTRKNLQTLNAICIDIDFKTSLDASISTLKTIDAVNCFYGDYILNEIIPAPTYIEYGRNFRLVYVLNQPYLIPQSNAKRQSVFVFFRRIIQVLAETIQSYADWGVDSCYNIAPFVRIPESINEKKSKGQSCQYEVKIAQYCSSLYRWDIQELVEYVLPDKPEWYDGWKAKPKGKKAKQSRINRALSLDGLFTQRMKDLETLQSLGWDIGYREKMTFLYRLTAIQSGMSLDQAKDAALRFNRNFEHPLHDHTVVTECKPSNTALKYRNATIRQELGLGERDYPHLFTGDGLSRHDRYEAEKQKKISDGGYIPKAQQLEATYDKIIAMQKNGMQRNEIEIALSIPKSTMTRYLRTIRERETLGVKGSV